ncbi:MAG: hypothetical protein KIT44_11945 [Opitutaceae bacterium]|nr:hypothetical protein [Opitutaceae bacterium]
MPIRCFVLFFVCLAGATAQTTLYFDDFSGSGLADLHGTAPDIRPGSETWQAGTGAAAWKADGSASEEGNQNAFLPFTPVAGHRYTLSVTANPQSAADAWFALGFSTTAAVDGFYAITLDAGPWLLLRGVRPNLSDGIQTFFGPNTAQGQSHGADSGFLYLSVVLDTTAADWEVTWRAGDTILRQQAYVGGNPDINYVALGKYGNLSVSISDFSLTQSAAVPEPANVALVIGLLAGATILVARRRHSQSLKPADQSGT